MGVLVAITNFRYTTYTDTSELAEGEWRYRMRSVENGERSRPSPVVRVLVEDAADPAATGKVSSEVPEITKLQSGVRDHAEGCVLLKTHDSPYGDRTGYYVNGPEGEYVAVLDSVLPTCIEKDFRERTQEAKVTAATHSGQLTGFYSSMDVVRMGPGHSYPSAGEESGVVHTSLYARYATVFPLEKGMEIIMKTAVKTVPSPGERELG